MAAPEGPPCMSERCKQKNEYSRKSESDGRTHRVADGDHLRTIVAGPNDLLFKQTDQTDCDESSDGAK